jgi:mRNA-degrading endonuclease RelE of RelBE toxin-antitoxin system
MNYDISISPDAVTGYQDIPYEDRAHFREFIHFRLTSNPEESDDHTSKGLLGVREVRCSLSAGEAHVFYDVIGPSVEILLIFLSMVHTKASIVITRQGTPIATIPKVGVQRVSESELQKRIDASRYRIRSGEGILLNDLPF